MLIELMNSFNHLPVEVNKISGTHLLWRNQDTCSDMSDSQFVDSYSWIIKNNFFADESRIFHGATQTMFAERYGGFGTGINGGGARVVNYNDVQIKGVGGNILAGEGALKSHSYGGLDIQGAVKEVIYSRLLNKISPVGAQTINGLILLDESSALHNGNKAPSMLMIREPVMRPAHFLPCSNFKRKSEHRTFMRSDYSRVLGIYKGIGKQALLSDFYVLIQNFLEKCADQLSFFRMARLSHNALTPSNISMDGRILDTALCSFVISGSNYGQVTSYLEEASIPVVIAKELFYLIHKFSMDKPVEEHFLELYEGRFYQYASVNMGFMFGLDREISTKLSCCAEWEKLSSCMISLLSVGSNIKTSNLPTVDSADFVNEIMTASLYAVLHRKVNADNEFLVGFTRDLDALVMVMASSLARQGQNKKSFCKTLSIQTIKRTILSSYFFITYIGRTVDDYCAAGHIDNTATIINENDHIASWIYENLLSERATLYSGNGISIEYSSERDDYIYRDKYSIEKRINDVQLVRSIIDSNKIDYVVQKYDFYPYLKQLLAFIDGDATNSFSGVRNVFC